MSKRRLVGTRIARRFPSCCLRWLRRPEQAQHRRARPVIACFRRGLLLQRDVLVAHRAHQRRVCAAIGLPKHIAAHHVSTADRNPDARRLVWSQSPLLNQQRMRAIIHGNSRLGDWWKPPTLVGGAGPCRASSALAFGWKPRTLVRGARAVCARAKEAPQKGNGLSRFLRPDAFCREALGFFSPRLGLSQNCTFACSQGFRVCTCKPCQNKVAASTGCIVRKNCTRVQSPLRPQSNILPVRCLGSIIYPAC